MSARARKVAGHIIGALKGGEFYLVGTDAQGEFYLCTHDVRLVCRAYLRLTEEKPWVQRRGLKKPSRKQAKAKGAQG